jgi:hypothetical protein
MSDYICPSANQTTEDTSRRLQKLKDENSPTFCCRTPRCDSFHSTHIKSHIFEF